MVKILSRPREETESTRGSGLTSAVVVLPCTSELQPGDAHLGNCQGGTASGAIHGHMLSE